MIRQILRVFGTAGGQGQGQGGQGGQGERWGGEAGARKYSFVCDCIFCPPSGKVWLKWRRSLKFNKQVFHKNLGISSSRLGQAGSCRAEVGTTIAQHTEQCTAYCSVLHTVVYGTLQCTALHTVLYCTLYCIAVYYPCTLHCPAHCSVLNTVVYCTLHNCVPNKGISDPDWIIPRAKNKKFLNLI